MREDLVNSNQSSTSKWSFSFPAPISIVGGPILKKNTGFTVLEGATDRSLTDAILSSYDADSVISEITYIVLN